MRICFVTENKFEGKIPPNITDRRTEFEWMIMLDAFHYNYDVVVRDINKLKEFDVVLFVLPKTKPYLVGFIRKVSKEIKTVLLQEGPSYLWQDLPTELQIEYFEMLQEVDGVLCHNDIDKKYFSGLTNKPVFKIPTFINIPFVETTLGMAKTKKAIGACVIGGNGSNWYNGNSSVSVVKDFNEIKIVGFPTMGRKLENEEILMRIISGKEVHYMPYMSWDKFLITLSMYEYAIHLMPTPAAGSFHLMCAVAGVPCIGPKTIDTQRVCFPELSVDSPFDIVGARRLLRKLITDKNFYKRIIDYAKKKAREFNASDCAEKVLSFLEKDVVKK